MRSGRNGGNRVARLGLNIGTGAEFKSKLTANPTGSFTLTADIDMKGAALQVASFSGVLDGGNHTIKNVTQSSSGNAGLFGVLTGATVKNLKLSNVNFSASSAGGLASQCVGAIVQNVAVQGNVQAGNTAGGICGGMSGGSLTGSSASGSVKSTSGSAGGLAGSSSIGRDGLGSVISSCSVASMTVTGVQSAGGLMGYCQDVTILRAAVDATVSGQSTAGGLCGEMNGGSISHSYAKGANVTATGGPAGGLVGRSGLGQLGEPSNRMEVTSTYAQYANVTASLQAGGLLGIGLDPSLSDVYAVGNVTGTGAVGGLIGRTDSLGRGWSLNNGIYRGIVNDRFGDWAGVIGVYDWPVTPAPRWELTLFDTTLDPGSNYAMNESSQRPATTTQLKSPIATPSGIYCFNVPPATRCADSAFADTKWDPGTAAQHHILKNMPGPNVQLR